jgi:hypothetical protein
VYINGTPACRWLIDANQPPGLRVAHITRPFAAESNYTVRFVIDRPYSPFDINESHDKRLFGLGLRSFRVRPLEDAVAS